jgi:predicted nucleic acid-binding protein
MSYWDSSALLKLYVHEADSAQFRALALEATRVTTASLTGH